MAPIRTGRVARDQVPTPSFTEAGLQELRVLPQDRRAVDPERFEHLRRGP
jgi:hypothetical protein